MRQKLALVVKVSLSTVLRRMNGFSPVRITELGSAVLIDVLPFAFSHPSRRWRASPSVRANHARVQIARWPGPSRSADGTRKKPFTFRDRALANGAYEHDSPARIPEFDGCARAGGQQPQQRLY